MTMRTIDLRALDGSETGCVCTGEGKFPRLAQYADGTLFVATHRGTHHEGANNSLQGFVSEDGGRTWGPARTMCERAGIDPRSPAIGVGPDAALYCGWKELAVGQPGVSRVCFYRSDDCGGHWQFLAEIPVAEPERRGHTFGKLLFEADGTILMNVYTFDTGRATRMDSRLYAGRADGTRWTLRSTIAECANETSLLWLRDGALLAQYREDAEGQRVSQRESRDSGRTWMEPAPVTAASELPAESIALPGGRALCVYGRRHPPFGVRARLSEDGGRSWRDDVEFVVDDTAPSGDCGYPTAERLADGTLVVCWYVNNDRPADVQAERQCRWLRFREDALV
jgi:hypothetical protein